MPDTHKIGPDRLANTGSQWQEGRGFDRIYSGNPYAQVEFIKTLIGFYERFTLDQKPDAQPNNAIILGTLAIFCNLYPDWKAEHYELDRDFGLPAYSADSEFISRVDRYLPIAIPQEDTLTTDNTQFKAQQTVSLRLQS